MPRPIAFAVFACALLGWVTPTEADFVGEGTYTMASKWYPAFHVQNDTANDNAVVRQPAVVDETYLWTFTAVNVYGTKVKNVGSLLYMTAAGTGNNANVTQEADGAAHQAWNVTEPDAGYYTFTLSDVARSVEAWIPGGPDVKIYNSNGQDWQKWNYVDTGDGDGSLFLFDKQDESYALRVGDTSAGSDLVATTDPTAGDDLAKWLLEQTLLDTKYKIQTNVAGSDYVLTTAGTGNNASVVLAPYVPGDPNQLWGVSEVDVGGELYYELLSVAAAKNMEAWASGGLVDGTNVQIYNDNNHDWQRWTLERVESDIPEPATLALACLAACGLGGYVRRRRKA